MPKADNVDYLDYFSGGVPAGALFSLNVADIRGILRSTPVPGDGLDPAAEICFIGLVAYFEAFCRDHFASLLNICPQLVREFKSKGRDVSVDSSILLTFDDHPRTRIGFMLAERYEFGTAKSVNSLYTDLLSVTPFSKDEGVKFEQILNDRNLLVHHGGVYTSRYAGQTFVKRRTKQRIFFDSLVIRRRTLDFAASFFIGIAKKTMAATQDSLIRYMGEKRIRPMRAEKKSIDALLWW